MRTFVSKILILALASCVAIPAFASGSVSGGNLFRKHTADTSEINIHIRRALNTLRKTKDPAVS